VVRPAAMFFDIENIVGGYGEGDEGFARRVAGVSLTSIQGQIAEACSEPIGQFAVKRAYADWSQRDLRTLRKTLVEQGIEPRQVFGFGQGGKTNAADVELVIDVLELLHSRDEVSTYVIVSGDGGFGSLVRKLHEFGKQVIVAGHADRASGALRAVCDEFVVLDPPESLIAPAQNTSTGRAVSGPGPVDLLRAAAGPPPPIPARDPDDLLEAGTAFIAAVTADPGCRDQLDKDGFLLANVGDVLKAFAAPDAIRSAFRGLRPFLSQILEGSNWIAAAGSAGQPARIVRRETAPAIDTPSSDPNALTFSDDERASIEAAKSDPLDLPGALASVLIAMHLRAGGRSLEIGQLMHDARGTGLREAAQGFFGTTTTLFRVALAGTDLCVMQSIDNPTQNWIRSRIEFDGTAGDAESMRILDDLPMPSRAQLARAVLVRTGLRLPTDPDDIDDVLRALARMPLKEDETLNELISRLVGSETLPAAVQLGALRQMLAALIEVGVLVGPSRSSADWLDQPARQTVKSRVEMLAQLRGPIVDALRPHHLDHDEVLAGLLPIGSGASVEGAGAGRPA
jgi:uncharacterized protein (TIGR00288 family)